MSVIEEACTITAADQTTVPKAIRQALGVSCGGRIAVRIEGDTISVHPATEPDEDPALAPFLALLERDIAIRPEALAPLTPEPRLAAIRSPGAARPVRQARSQCGASPPV
jgi:antitoxin PrlF